MTTPILSPQQQQHTRQLTELIVREIERNHGAIPFDRYMELALYAPGLGYYTSGNLKLGAGGDFVTAPEISPLFSRCLANQCAQILGETGGGDILEFGAGTGRMAADILAELDRRGRLPDRYCILELSPDLQQRQRETLAEKAPHFLRRVSWLTDLPAGGFTGVVLANELLDAMPVSRFRQSDAGAQEQYVAWHQEQLVPRWRAVDSPHLASEISGLEQSLGGFAPGYESEVNLRLGPWIGLLGQRLSRAAVILIDYGYSRHEYYHAERSMGTLICHFRHRAHADPFILPGLQDITASVDFTAVASSAAAAGFELAGYTTQANFLLGCGLDRLMAESDPHQVSDHLSLVQGVKQLTLPGEMGERFKAIALTKGLTLDLMGFSIRDLAGRL